MEKSSRLAPGSCAGTGSALHYPGPVDAKSQRNGPREATWRRKTLERLGLVVADELGDPLEKEFL